MEAAIPNNSIFTGSVQIATIGKSSGGLLTLSLKIDWDAERTTDAMRTAAADGSIKSPLQIMCSSIEGTLVELRVTVRVDPSQMEGAKSILLRVAYLASH